MATESKKITFVFLRLHNPSRERATCVIVDVSLSRKQGKTVKLNVNYKT